MFKKLPLNLLKWSAFFVFIGRAYQHLFWDAPFRSFFWDQELLEPFILIFYPSWKEYVTNLNTDFFIQYLIKSFGFLYLICAFLSLNLQYSSKKIVKKIIQIGGFSLLLLALITTKDKFYSLAMFFEHSIQFTTSFLLVYTTNNKYNTQFLYALKIIIALTFVCHGIYATGILHPVPANFTSMTMNLLQLSETNSKTFLSIMGYIDFIIGITIFIPKLSNTTLIYAFFWGGITALARLAYGCFYEISFLTLHQYAYLTIYRIPHATIPLLAYFLHKHINKS